MLKAINALLGWFCKLWAPRASFVHPSPGQAQDHPATLSRVHIWAVAPDHRTLGLGRLASPKRGLAILEVEPVPGQKRTDSLGCGLWGRVCRLFSLL